MAWPPAVDSLVNPDEATIKAIRDDAYVNLQALQDLIDTADPSLSANERATFTEYLDRITNAWPWISQDLSWLFMVSWTMVYLQRSLQNINPTAKLG